MGKFTRASDHIGYLQMLHKDLYYEYEKRGLPEQPIVLYVEYNCKSDSAVDFVYVMCNELDYEAEKLSQLKHPYYEM